MICGVLYVSCVAINIEGFKWSIIMGLEKEVVDIKFIPLQRIGWVVFWVKIGWF